MKNTRLTTILIVATVGGVAGAFVQMALATNGRPIISLPLTLAIALAAIGALVITLALPIRRMTRGNTAPRVDPFYATRIVMLAKACVVTGSLIAGFGIGMLAYLLSRSVVPVGSVAQAIATIVGAGVLLAGGLIAEHMCRIPPTDDDDPGDGPVKA